MCKEAHTANAAQYVEVVRARAPRGFADAIREAAGKSQRTPSEFIRVALSEKLQAALQQKSSATPGVAGSVLGLIEGEELRGKCTSNDRT
jgi:hypothetical protein